MVVINTNEPDWERAELCRNSRQLWAAPERSGSDQQGEFRSRECALGSVWALPTGRGASPRQGAFGHSSAVGDGTWFGVWVDQNLGLLLLVSFLLLFVPSSGRYESVIATLCENLDSLDEPEARAAMIWIVGEYAERIDNADELLESFLEGFHDESTQVCQGDLLPQGDTVTELL